MVLTTAPISPLMSTSSCVHKSASVSEVGTWTVPDRRTAGPPDRRTAPLYTFQRDATAHFAAGLSARTLIILSGDNFGNAT
jgi:hypothetical protein